MLIPLCVNALSSYPLPIHTASRIWHPFDAAAADRYLQRARLALTFLDAHPLNTPVGGFKNPAGHRSGPYYDSEDSDNRCWLAAELWRTTCDASYAGRFEVLFDANKCFLGWNDFQMHGLKAQWAFYLSNCPGYDHRDYKTRIMNSNLKPWFTKLLLQAEGNAFRTIARQDVFSWVNFGTFAMLSNAEDLMLGAYLFPATRQQYDNAMIGQANVALGANPLSMSFITGLGARSPQHPLHWSRYLPADQPPPGIAVFGPAARMDNTNTFNYQAQADENNHPPRSGEDSPFPVYRRYTDDFLLVQNSEFGINTMGTTCTVFTYLKNYSIETPYPTKSPTVRPTARPTATPSSKPSAAPTGQPTGQPTEQPSGQPTEHPSGQPTEQPSGQPTEQPSGQPSGQPTKQPSGQPTEQPSGQPSGQPTEQPSGQPTEQPSGKPTRQPSGQPTEQPSGQPTEQPSGQPSGQPTEQPSSQPSGQPTEQPSGQPSEQPSGQPSGEPTEQPSGQPTEQPSGQPSEQPSGQPTEQPSGQPSGQPTEQPSGQPSGQPTGQPSGQPTAQPSGQPTEQPSGEPTEQPSGQPSGQPTEQPSGQPTRQPTAALTSRPSAVPSAAPTAAPPAAPSAAPTAKPSVTPSATPSVKPTTAPSAKPSAAPASTSPPTKAPTKVPTAAPTPVFTTASMTGTITVGGVAGADLTALGAAELAALESGLEATLGRGSEVSAWVGEDQRRLRSSSSISQREEKHRRLVSIVNFKLSLIMESNRDLDTDSFFSTVTSEIDALVASGNVTATANAALSAATGGAYTPISVDGVTGDPASVDFKESGPGPDPGSGGGGDSTQLGQAWVIGIALLAAAACALGVGGRLLLRGKTAPVTPDPVEDVDKAKCVDKEQVDI
jgi:hypothetical protein